MIHLALQLGIVSLDGPVNDTYFTSANMKGRSQAYQRRSVPANPGGQSEKEFFFRMLGSNLNLVQKDDSTKNTRLKKMTFVNPEGLEVTDGIREALYKTMLADDPNYHVFGFEPASKSVPGGFKGEILNSQLNVIDDLFTALERGNRFRKERVFAKALRGASPGKDMDVVIFS
jgi:hypothetical protein